MIKITKMDLNKFDRNKPKIKLNNLKVTGKGGRRKLIAFKDNEIKK